MAPSPRGFADPRRDRDGDSKAHKKLTTTTDDQGAYGFADLPDGVWTLEIESMGFAMLRREVAIAPDAPSPTWELKLLTLAEATQELAPTEAAEAAAKPVVAAPSATADRPAGQPSNSQPSNSQPGSSRRPSLRQPGAPGGFQRLDIKQSGDIAAAGANDAAATGGADSSQSSDALFVNGSLNNGLNQNGLNQNDWNQNGLNPQQNDWASGGRGGLNGLGGPGGMDVPPGAMGGGPGGGRGGGMMGSGRVAARRRCDRRWSGGGRGGFRQGQGGRGGRANQASFGNARTSRRMRYNGNANFSLDNSALDARPFSLTGQNTPQAAYAKLRSSVMFGGPLKIPHLLDGTKSSFNINYQFSRSRNGSTFSGLMPTAAERAGDFSHAVNPVTGAPVAIYDPLSGKPFPDNVIPAGSISAQAQSLLAYYPLPNFVATARFNYQIPLTGVTNQDNVNTRLNHTFNANNQVNGGLGYQRSTTTPNGFGFSMTPA